MAGITGRREHALARVRAVEFEVVAYGQERLAVDRLPRPEVDEVDSVEEIDVLEDGEVGDEEPADPDSIEEPSSELPSEA